MIKMLSIKIKMLKARVCKIIHTQTKRYMYPRIVHARTRYMYMYNHEKTNNYFKRSCLPFDIYLTSN